MKNFRKLAILLPMILTIGCSEGDTDDVESTTEVNFDEHNHGVTVEGNKLRIIDCNRVTDVKVKFNVDISKVKGWNRFGVNIPQGQVRTRFRWVKNELLALAARRISGIANNINVRVVTNGAADIIIGYNDGQFASERLGRSQHFARFPKDGKPGKAIYLSSNMAAGRNAMNKQQVLGLLLHELMHTFGFHHNVNVGLAHNPIVAHVAGTSRAETPAIFESLAGYDPISFMDTDYIELLTGKNLGQVDFTRQDKIAFRRLYTVNNRLCARRTTAGRNVRKLSDRYEIR